MWSLPEQLAELNESYNLDVHHDLEERFAAKLKHIGQGDPIQHAFSHYQLTLYPLRFQFLKFTDHMASPKPYAWHTVKQH